MKPTFNHVSDFRQGLALVELGNRFVYINKLGDVVAVALDSLESYAIFGAELRQLGFQVFKRRADELHGCNRTTSAALYRNTSHNTETPQSS